jgi:23S rRNA (pseudouridine1915-N3)-methyltransferase
LNGALIALIASMQIHLVAATNRQPAWVDAACAEYAKRLRGSVRLKISDVRLARRSTSDSVDRARDDEAGRMLAALPKGAYVLALCETGATWTTAQLAAQMAGWMRAGETPGLLIGGPDGLGQACLDAARTRWSLSALTLPHGLAKIVTIEALYRAWSLLEGHPYHRP